MVLEATVICIDNSEWMRNGDYLPTRFEAQNDAATLIFNGRTNSNPENSVGLISMAGKSPEVLVTLTQDLGTLLTAIAGVKIHGNCHFQAAIQVAQLCLKHRQNKNQRQRIIAFVGSPIDVDKKELIRLGKRLKKNNIAVDIISFGEVFENEEKLTAFQNAVNNNDNSHLIPIPYGDAVMSDWLLQSQFLFTGDESDEGSGGGGFNLSNPDNDPNIALAIRLSMEEAQERAARESGGDNKPAGATPGESSAAAPAQPAPAPAAVAPMDQEDEDDEELALALAMSQEESRSAAAAAAPAPAPGDAPAAQPAPAPAPAPAAAPADMDVEEDDDDDEEMRLALEMSKQSSSEPSAPSSTKTEPAVKTASDQAREAISDPEFLASVLGGLEGVNPNDARIQDALKGLKKDEKK